MGNVDMLGRSSPVVLYGSDITTRIWLVQVSESLTVASARYEFGDRPVTDLNWRMKCAWSKNPHSNAILDQFGLSWARASSRACWTRAIWHILLGVRPTWR